MSNTEEAQGAEVLLTLSRAAKILIRNLPEDDEVKTYLAGWSVQAGAWAGRLLLETLPLDSESPVASVN